MFEEHTPLDTWLLGDSDQPICCYFCGSTEVIFSQIVGDTWCEECGAWQTEEDE